MKRIIIIYAIAVIALPIASIGTMYALFKPKQQVETCKTVKDRAKHLAENLHDEEIAIIPLNEDNEGRALYNVVLPSGKVIEMMYAEEIAMSLLRDSIVVDEMIHFCDHIECKEGQ